MDNSAIICGKTTYSNPVKNEYAILVVDDEMAIRELICDALSMSQFTTKSANDGLDALSKIRKERFDLVILDLNLPKLDGLSLLEKIRNEGSQVPVLILSARRDRSDITTGLKNGADDYLTKPFGIEELVLRVKAILRRTNPETNVKRELTCGPITIDLDRYQATFKDDLVELSATEFRLLEALILRAGKVVTKDNLLATVWGIDFETNSTVVDTYISYLRKKFHKDGFEGIKTVRGIGFQILGES
jgi:two-component system OmpR family response regulator